MGSVWIAEHLALSSEVALKIIDPRIASRDMGVPRFLREARALAALRSPHVVHVMDFGSDGDIVYLVMELLEGRTLGQRLKAEGKLSARETNRILCEVCKAMSHAHERGIVHRDLKPDNIFLCDQSREHVTKVVDFGIAKALGDVAAAHTGTEAGTFLGTPSYMSPEQCRDAKSIDPRSDLWALGAITYECLLGKRLFQGDVLGDLVVRICTEALPVDFAPGELPAGFAAWLSKAMARDPKDRFQSAAGFARALSAALELASESTQGVDSAPTLQEERLPAFAPAVAAALGSTLDHGLVAQSTARASRKPPRNPLVLALGGAGIIAAIATVALLRNESSPAPVETGAAPREAERAASGARTEPPALATAPGATPGPVGGVSSGSGVAQSELGEGRPDGGLARAGAKHRSVRQPPLAHPSSAAEGARPARAQPAEAELAPPDARQTDGLRKKR
jgi:serine/threonine-protein kinase